MMVGAIVVSVARRTRSEEVSDSCRLTLGVTDIDRTRAHPHPMW
jgi:hypothetical protein